MSVSELIPSLEAVMLSEVVQADYEEQSVKQTSIADLSVKCKLHIFRYLNSDSAINAFCVCREWAILNARPLGKVLHMSLKICNLFRFTLPKVHSSTCYEMIEEQSQSPVLQSSSYLCRSSTKKPTSLSEQFLMRDPTKSDIQYGLKGIQSELKTDPKLKDLVDRTIEAERETMDTHTPFYHSANRTVFMFGYSVKRLLATMNHQASIVTQQSNSVFERVHWFRFPQLRDSSYPIVVSEFPCSKMSHPDYDDHSSPLKEWILAVNPSLFCNAWTNGEGTWDLFILNKSVYPPATEAFFNLLCDNFGLLPNKAIRKEFFKEYEQLIGLGAREATRWIKTQRSQSQRDQFEFGMRGNRDLGALFQILVPKSIVDDVVYPCREYGVPKEYAVKKMSEVSREIEKNPHENYKAQGRMLNASLIQPQNEIIVNTYGTPEYFETQEGKRFVMSMDGFFMRALAASLTPSAGDLLLQQCSEVE